MDEQCAVCVEAPERDWAGNWKSFVGFWGLPAVIMVGAWILAEPMPRALLWSLMLVWMGAACIANARRCSRTHCRFTGPFFLLMAVLVAAYGAGMLPLGTYGWIGLSGVALFGNAILWWGSERLWGRFTR